jgi:hypothetical protein
MKKISHRQNASKSNRKMVEKDKIDTANTQILDRYFPDLVQATWGKSAHAHAITSMTSDQACAMVRSSASSSNMVLSVPIYYYYTVVLTKTNIMECYYF